MKTFATLAVGNTFSSGPGGPIVGRIVANTAFLRALIRHANFESWHFFVGDGSEGAAVERLVLESGWLEPARVRVRNLLEIPGAFARSEVSVFHYGSHLDRYLDLVALRDRHAQRTIPVTGQIHSLSYPRSLADYLRWRLVPPGHQDAVFCSSESGRRVLVSSLEAVSRDLVAAGAGPLEVLCELPVIPLGVDCESLQSGQRDQLRAELGLARDVVSFLVLARFSDADKMDLMPALQAFRELRRRWTGPGPEPVLVLAGARQGDDLPERLELWARRLEVADRVVFLVDLPEERKPDLLAAADVFLSPCDNPQETFGVSVAEALAAGLPCLVSDYDGYKELVDDSVGRRVTTRQGGDLGALSEVGNLVYERPLHHLLGQGLQVDVGELAAAMEQLASDEAQREEMGRNARARAGARLDWSRVIPRYEATWSELAACSKRPRAAGRVPLTLQFGEVFAHYPTAALAPDLTVSCTSLGNEIAGEGGEFPRSGAFGELVPDSLIRTALQLAEAPLEVGQLIERLGGHLEGRPRWLADQIVAWLLKQDLLRAS